MCSTLVLALKDLVLQTDSARTQGGEPIVALAAPQPLSDASRMACAVAVPRAAWQSSKEIAVLASVAPVLAASVREVDLDSSCLHWFGYNQALLDCE